MDQLLIQSFHSYRHGLLKKRGTDLLDDGAAYTARLWQRIETRLAGKELQLLRTISRNSIEGLKLARKGNHKMARNHFDLSHEYMARLPAQEEAHLLAVSVSRAAEAYLQHRLACFDKAREMVWEALDADEKLERLYGYNLLIGHRIQLVHNTMRVAIRQKRYDEGYELIGGAVAFMEGYSESIPLHHSWRRECLTPDFDAHIMIRQLMSETSVTMPRNSPKVWAGFCQAIKLDTYAALPKVANSHCREWVILKNLYESGKFGLYLERLPNFLEDAFVEDVGIFYATVADLTVLAGSMGSSIAKDVHAQLLRDALKWKGVPRSLKVTFQIPEKDESVHTKKDVGALHMVATP